MSDAISKAIEAMELALEYMDSCHAAHGDVCDAIEALQALQSGEPVAEEIKLYQLIIHVFRTHYESASDSHDSVLMSSLSKDLLIEWYNKNLESTGYRHAKPIPEGCERVEFPGNTGGGCFSVDCTVFIKEVPLLSSSKGEEQ